MGMKDDKMQDMDMKDDKTTDLKMNHDTTKGMNMKGDKMDGMDMTNKKMDIRLDEFNNSNYEILKSTEPIVFPKKSPLHAMTLELVGDMRRYIWGFNDKPLSKDAMIPVAYH